MTMSPTIYLIDGSAYIYRAYHAISPLTTKQGLPTHAVYGFITILRRLMRERTPEYVAVAFDAKGPGFRHALYPQYKANRPPMPPDLAVQLPYVRQIVAGHNILALEETGVEADDLIASAVRSLTDQGYTVVIVSGDKDLLQLVSSQVSLWDPMNDRIMDPAAVAAKYQVPVAALLEFFALVGDSSDNVPGVPGIGPKSAEKLINAYGSLEGIYARLEEITGNKVRTSLMENRDKAFLSRDLIRLKSDLAVPGDLSAYRLRAIDEDALRRLYTELEFTSLAKSELSAPKLDSGGYRLITDEDGLNGLCTQLATATVLAVDTETTSLDTLRADLVGISLATNSDAASYIALGHRDAAGNLLAGQLPIPVVLDRLRPFLENPGLPKIGHNLKYDYNVLFRAGIEPRGPLWDTMVASYMLDPGRRSHKLDDLCAEFLGRRLTSFAEVTSDPKEENAFAAVPMDHARDYSCEDVHGALLLWESFRPKMEEQGLWDLFSKTEVPLITILADMERRGILVAPDLLANLSAEFEQKLAELEKEVYRHAGVEFNIASTKQLGEILFEKLQLPRDRKTKTGHSTDIKVLEKLARVHPLPAAVIAHRALAKLKNTYVDRLPELIHPSTGRVHSSFNQTVTATGRLSSSTPNLQNIPIRTPEGQRIRQAFIPAPGCVLVAADYSQIDLRVLAHYSQDAALLEAFRTGKDIHTETAAEIFGTCQEFVTKPMRRIAKSINFGIVYGMSAFGLANQLDLSRKEAATFIDRYFVHYPGVKRFMEEIVVLAREKGYVTTLLGRRRYLPDINAANKTKREFAERTAINTPIQGTAADIIKLAMIAVERELAKSNMQAAMVLQIHDELVFEVPEAQQQQTAVLVQAVMEAVLPLDVPLGVNVAVGRSLAEV